ncbi:HD domain-containing phosphohydrolase [Methylovulum psychrotolerans]|uniref:Helix-turn-helix domain-containing protein n=2 Tax=Methylovulum psychrotolerans TaxID=1704499 RepID=A0A2S5CJ39_9GAMM|nr:HD domain-containing phosphohydrolase [Methylovulum psychrotolerans]POZ50809.1 helix-turn-helix domain-containing protein [Methylovulum psychrotolerans]
MASSISPNKIYLTPNEVAELLMVSPVTVRSWAQKGVLVAKVTPGGHRRFLKSDVENFVRDSGVAYVEAKPSVSRILIVDNDPLMMTYVYDILNGSGLGFVLATAQNGFEAGAKMYAFAPDVVLVNVMLPDGDAFLITSQIKKDLATRHISVIAITADTATESIARILAAGAETFLAKPFSPQDLLGLLSHTASVSKTGRGGAAKTDQKPSAKLSEAESLLFSLKRLVETKNNYIGHHDATRLKAMVGIFGRSLGFSPEQLQALHNACVLHDIGNLGIPDSILLKPAPLTEEEWTVMRSHTVIGAQLCASLKEMESTVQIIRSHHERWNGSGYPDGLKGEAIPLLARAFQIVDIFDALTSPRPYKPALDFAAVIDIIKQEIAEGWLDPQLGRIFLELLETRPQDFAVIPSVDEAA